MNSNDIDFDNISEININYKSVGIDYYNRRVIDSNRNLQVDEDILNFIKDISNKKKRIFSFFEDELKVKRDEIKSLTDKKNSLELKTYSELLEMIDPNYDEEYNGEVYDIAKFMLRRGYIDESFSNYISYFHEGDLSAAENNFILELKNNRSLGYEYKLENLKLLLSKLDKRDFKNANFYNIYLLDYLLANSDSTDKHFQECFKVAINTICNQTEENNDFISFYINFHFNKCEPQIFRHIINKLYTVLSDNWDEAFIFLHGIVQRNAEEQKAILLYEILESSSVIRLVEQNKYCILSGILELLDNFIEFFIIFPVTK